jgi:hypothetical protein
MPNLDFIKFFSEDYYRFASLIVVVFSSLAIALFGKGPVWIRITSFLMVFAFALLAVVSAPLLGKHEPQLTSLSGSWSLVRGPLASIADNGSGNLTMQNENNASASATFSNSTITIGQGAWQVGLQGHVTSDLKKIDWDPPSGGDIWIRR